VQNLRRSRFGRVGHRSADATFPGSANQVLFR
jgi:hypothetical protein